MGCRPSGFDPARSGELKMAVGFNRRQIFTIGAGAFAVATWGASRVHAQAANDAEDIVKKFTAGKKPTEGKVRLDLPEIAENGNTVPMTVTVESPMTEQSHVTDVLVVADANPRIRLAATQNITAVAKMNDGSLYATSKQVKVTIGGCGG